MKRCPECRREYDLSMSFCLDDGTELLYGPASGSEPPAIARGLAGPRGGDVEPATEIFSARPSKPSDIATAILQPLTTAASPDPSSDDATVKATRPTKPLVMLGFAALLLIGGFVGYRYVRSSGGEQINSIAVLPFQNKSTDANSDYLSDGLAESLIYRLSQLKDIKVSPTSSVARYKGKDTEVAKIASELGVDAVMTGRLAQFGDNLTISVELVDVRNNKLLWGEQYERKMSDLLVTQREIAGEIVKKLQLKLSGEESKGLTKRYTDNNDAYQLYLQGRFHFAKRTKDDILKGINYFQQAIELDPGFALAYASIADSYNSMGKNADLPPKEVLPQAKAAATRALEIDPTLAEAHGALADSLALYDWNWAESEREYGKAFQLDPNVSYIHLTHGVSYLAPLGKRDEAVAELKRAVELEPHSLITNAIFGLSYLYAGQNDKALEQGKRTYDLDPNFRFGRQYLGNTYIVLGRYDEAIALAEEGLKTSQFSQEDLVIAGLAYAKSGRRREGEQYLERFRELAKTRYVRTVFTASIYAALGDKDKAFAELEKSFVDKDCFLPRIKLDPFMDSLRDDPRYKDLLKRMGLPE
jgi:TolB-like protein/Tfp pilus assembly protein PilF